MLRRQCHLHSTNLSRVKASRNVLPLNLAKGLHPWAAAPTYLNPPRSRSTKPSCKKCLARLTSGILIIYSQWICHRNSRRTMITCRLRALPQSLSPPVTKTAIMLNEGPNTLSPPSCKTCRKRFKRQMTLSKGNHRQTRLEISGSSFKGSRTVLLRVTSVWPWRWRRWKKNRKKVSTITAAFPSMGDLVLWIPQKPRLTREATLICSHLHSEGPPSG